MTIDILAPAEQEGTKAVLKSWLKKIGDPVRVNDPVVELETDKVAVEVAAESNGVLAEILVAPDAKVEPGMVLGRIADGPADVAPAPKAALETQVAADVAAGGRSIASFDPALRLSPSVRRALLENDLDPRGIAGTGKDGRLTRQDVETALAGRPHPALSEGGVTRLPHDTMRRRIAEHMAQSLQTAPHVTAVFEADFGAIIAHRTAHKEAFAKGGVNLTFTAYFIAASAVAMKAAPAVNGRWFEDHIELYDDVNVGVGTALGDKGLVVPVIHRAQTLSLFEIAGQLQGLAEKARSGTLARSDVQNGTFSISNHGVSGSLLAAPIIINQPQAAILGVGKLEKRVVVRAVDDSDAIQIRPMAFVSLSIDHRILDGHQTNAWLTRFIALLENWPA